MSDEELLDALSELPSHDVDSLRAASIQRRARSAFARAHEPPESALGGFRRFYRSTMEPLAVAAMIALHLGWAFQQVISLHT